MSIHKFRLGNGGVRKQEPATRRAPPSRSHRASSYRHGLPPSKQRRTRTEAGRRKAGERPRRAVVVATHSRWSPGRREAGGGWAAHGRRSPRHRMSGGRRQRMLVGRGRGWRAGVQGGPPDLRQGGAPAREAGQGQGPSARVARWFPEGGAMDPEVRRHGGSRWASARLILSSGGHRWGRWGEPSGRWR